MEGVLVAIGMMVLFWAAVKLGSGRKSDLDCANPYEIHESFQVRQARKRFKG